MDYMERGQNYDEDIMGYNGIHIHICINVCICIYIYKPWGQKKELYRIYHPPSVPKSWTVLEMFLVFISLN
jgi:hypothetical protein